MNPVHLKIIVGSTREGRFSDKAAAWVAKLAEQTGAFAVEVVDLKEYAMPFFDSAESPSFKSKPYEQPDVARFTAKIAEADAYIIVTPEYNHSTSAVLKNALDWVYQEWGRKPVAYVAYGSVGGARAVEHLRQIAVEVHGAPMREAVHFVGNEYFPVLFGQKPAEEMFAAKEEAAGVMLTELLWWAEALKTARLKS